MPQVVTADNLIEFTQTGVAPEFKPPEARAPDGAAGVKPAGAGVDNAAGVQPAQARGADGKFTAAKEGDTTSRAASPPPGDDGEKDLPELVRQKIGIKHRQMKEAEERERRETLRAIRAESEAADLRRKLEESDSKSRPAQAPEAPKEPKPEDFKTVAEYTDALVSWRVDKALSDRAKAESEAAEQREKEARSREFGKRIVEAREKHADFDDVLGSLKNTDMDRVHADVTEYIQESDHGAELLYHLAKHSDVLDRLRKLSPRRFIAELGKLETKFEAAPGSAKESPTLTEVAAAKTPPVSKAPAPIAPLETAGIAPVAKKPEEMSVSELRAYRQQQDREKRAAGRA